MSERGTFVLDRGWFDHPIFKKERYTEREAWAWLIALAAYRDHPRRVGAVQVMLLRGQATNSLRFMAEKWQWKEPRVRRFLSRLKSDAMIDLVVDAGVTVVTIGTTTVISACLPSSTQQSTRAPTQYRRSADAKKK